MTVTASAPTCAWTAMNAADWVIAVNPSNGAGSGSIAFTVLPNAGPARTTTMTIAGQPFTISQAGILPAP